MYLKLVICLVLSATLTGCATSNDPRKGGFFGGLVGINSGAYDSRVQQRKDELGREENINQDLKDKSKSLEAEARIRETELASEQQRLGDLEENLASLESDVGKLTARSAQQKTEIAAIKRKIQDQRRKIKSQQAALDAMERNGSNSERFRVLQQERNRLADEYKKLLEYSKALSDATK